ncbi:hypothetical protein [Guptibacillus algicola]|uniref:hypothetical protein n=1 Tax=Guptibacillus algicola TaxID=225844 RepID=UPI001CD648C5|nr:hypothetical protein [Alkalihalobacillus algicola]MCA0986512.1 hypothetical protein [Alkalihalobacillus algicola]
MRTYIIKEGARAYLYILCEDNGVLTIVQKLNAEGEEQVITLNEEEVNELKEILHSPKL